VHSFPINTISPPRSGTIKSYFSYLPSITYRLLEYCGIHFSKPCQKIPSFYLTFPRPSPSLRQNLFHLLKLLRFLLLYLRVFYRLIPQEVPFECAAVFHRTEHTHGLSVQVQVVRLLCGPGNWRRVQ
jgi:hypothetical protein